MKYLLQSGTALEMLELAASQGALRASTAVCTARTHLLTGAPRVRAGFEVDTERLFNRRAAAAEHFRVGTFAPPAASALSAEGRAEQAAGSTEGAEGPAQGDADEQEEPQGDESEAGLRGPALLQRLQELRHKELQAMCMATSTPYGGESLALNNVSRWRCASLEF